MCTKTVSFIIQMITGTTILSIEFWSQSANSNSAPRAALWYRVPVVADYGDPTKKGRENQDIDTPVTAVPYRTEFLMKCVYFINSIFFVTS